MYYADLAADRARFYVRDVYHVHVPRGGERRTFEQDKMEFNVNVHDNMKEQMFYI